MVWGDGIAQLCCWKGGAEPNDKAFSPLLHFSSVYGGAFLVVTEKLRGALWSLHIQELLLLRIPAAKLVQTLNEVVCWSHPFGDIMTSRRDFLLLVSPTWSWRVERLHFSSWTCRLYDSVYDSGKWMEGVRAQNNPPLARWDQALGFHTEKLGFIAGNDLRH